MTYLLYGLSWSLPFSSSMLPRTESQAEITVVFGSIDESDVLWSHFGVCYKAAQGAYLLSVPGIARYLVTNGKNILIEAHKNTSQEEIEYFLYNSVAGALLMQRGILPLHASAVEKNGKVSVFLGRSGYGKSLVAAGLVQRGFNFLTDTVCAVYPGEKFIVKAGYPHLYLWKEALLELGYDPAKLKKVRKNLEKYLLPMPQNAFSTEAPIEQLYIFNHINDSDYQKLTIKGQMKFTVLLKHTYHTPLIEAFNMQDEIYKSIISIASNYPLKRRTATMLIENANDFLEDFANHI